VSSSAAGPEWHRTSPIAAVFYLFNGARQLVLNMLPAIIVVTAFYASGSAGRKALILAGLAGLAVVALISSVLQWLRFRFAISGDRVLVRSGVFHREELSVEFTRIQNINIREPFYMRPFGLAVLGIDTAGSSQKEILLGGINKDLAARLRQTLLSAAKAESADPIAADDQANAPCLLERDSRDIVIYGLTVNFFIWVAIAVGAFFSTGETAEQIMGWVAERVRIEDLLAAAQSTGGSLLNTILVIGMVLAAILLLPLLSVAGALVRHHGYRLTVDGETYRRTGGFLTRHEESLKQHKIQAIVLKQNFVARLFGRSNLQLRVASAGTGVESGQLPTGAKATFLVPALQPGETEKLCQEFFPGCDVGAVQFSKINRGRLLRLVMGLVAIPAIAIGSSLGLLLSWKFLAVPAIAFAIAWLAANRYWLKAGYGVAGDYGYVRTGFIGTTVTVFPLFKVQRIDLRQTRGQRRHGLAKLTVHLASHSLEIPWVHAWFAEQFRDLALYYVETTDRAWY
jgi:putative membrane protein